MITAVAAMAAGADDHPTADQAQISQQGEAFFRKHFPKLDRILKARILR